jgi:hypothetical protein
MVRIRLRRGGRRRRRQVVKPEAHYTAPPFSSAISHFVFIGALLLACYALLADPAHTARSASSSWACG